MIEMFLTATFNRQKILDRCVMFGYNGSTDEALMKFYMDMLVSPLLLGYISNELEQDTFGERNIAWAIGKPE